MKKIRTCTWRHWIYRSLRLFHRFYLWSWSFVLPLPFSLLLLLVLLLRFSLFSFLSISSEAFIWFIFNLSLGCSNGSQLQRQRDPNLKRGSPQKQSDPQKQANFSLAAFLSPILPHSSPQLLRHSWWFLMILDDSLLILPWFLMTISDWLILSLSPSLSLSFSVLLSFTTVDLEVRCRWVDSSALRLDSHQKLLETLYDGFRFPKNFRLKKTILWDSSQLCRRFVRILSCDSEHFWLRSLMSTSLVDSLKFLIFFFFLMYREEWRKKIDGRLCSIHRDSSRFSRTVKTVRLPGKRLS